MMRRTNSQRRPKRLSLLAGALLAAISTSAWGQAVLLQGGTWTPGHAPMYVGQGSSQPVVQDAGAAGGGSTGSGLSELAVTARGTGSAPFASQGTGPLGTINCTYDGPTDAAAGYHYLCLSANAQGGGLITYGAGGAASALTLNMNINGTVYPFPFALSGVVGPGTTTVGHLAIWNNITGTLLADTATLPSGTIVPIATTTFTGQFSVANGGTGDATLTANGVLYGAGTSPVAITAAPSQYNVLVGNASGVPVFGQVNLAQSAAVTGTTPVANGGSGRATLTAHAVLVGNGTGAVALATVGTGGRLLIDQGGAADPSFNAMSQDCTITNAGVITCTKTNNVSFSTLATLNPSTTAITPTSGVAAAGGFSVSPRTFGTCGSNGGSIAATSAFTNQTPVATEVYIAEVFVPANVTVTGIAVLNGTAVSGNMKAGLANSSGVNVATSASTAASGTSVYQLVPFTSPYSAVGPATYYVTTFYDNNTQRATAWTQGSCGASKQTTQTYATGFTTITPPTTFTTALGPVANLY